MTELQIERKNCKWDRFWSPFIEGWAVFKDPQAHSTHIIAFWTRDQVKALCLYTNSEERRVTRNVVWHYYIVIQLAVSLASLCYGVLESIDDIAILGRDLVFIISVIFIFFRLIFFAQYANDVDAVIDALEDIHHCETKGPGRKEVQATKRLHFLLFMALIIAWFTFLISFVLIKISTPFWMESVTLPFHVAWPCHLHDPSKHPIAYCLIFVSQSTTLTYFLVWLGAVENMAVSIFFELTSSLRVLCIELRNLQEHCHGDESLLERELHRLTKFHQRIILLSDHWHLSFWSKFGDMLSEESAEVAEAVYEAYDPTVGSINIHQHFRFFILRAQKPLIMRASPFPPFNLILKQCYSILTVLSGTLE
ncbi:hypothetical protein M5D96_006722 [Drosophila gunungcola]|uniref:Odorant receptor n=1 Tax=Drosophila gunungcola TaxID=103775 RepID=A0A9P9YPJ1_9MUSC|nr:hypothetical protein M5D96_006722 [Drosophila gunungcola]